MEIAIIGVNHHTAPIQIREKVAFTDSQKIEALNELKDFNIDEVVILSTCNRSEIYIASQNVSEHYEKIHNFYSKYSQTDSIKNYLFQKKGKDALRHLYDVAAGLDSLVVGEDQILGQVRDAHEFAMEVGSAGKVLNKCFREAITTAKHIKSTTKISEYPLSVSYIGFKYLYEKMGKLKNKKGLIIGAGKMSQLALKYLYEADVDKLYIANRTCKKAEDLKQIYPKLITISYEKRYEILQEVDFIITSTSSPHLIIRKEHMPKCSKQIYMLDLALPRDIDPDIRTHKNVLLYDIDDLESQAAENINRRKQLAEHAKTNIEEQIDALMIWLKTMRVDPMIHSLHERCDVIQKDTMHYIKRKLDLNQKEEKIIEKMIMSSLKRLIREPIQNLKEIEDKKIQETYLETLKQLFDL
ncbi:MAG: glutamyl-tRNA reductase [Cellulosilyticaceae bacterium]